MTRAGPAHTPQNDVLEAALGYARRGWALVPIRRGSKVPLTKHGVLDATTDEKLIRAWWGLVWPSAGVALALGQASGVVALDVDSQEGERKLQELAAPFGHLPATLTSKTGRGRHWFFSVPDGTQLRTRTLAPSVELLAEGHLATLPPSVHESGKHYEWENDLEPAMLPSWLAAIAEEAAATPGATPNGEPIPQGQRNSTLTSLAGSMRRRGMTPEAIETALLTENKLRCSPPLPEREVRAIVTSISRYEPAVRATEQEHNTTATETATRAAPEIAAEQCPVIPQGAWYGVSQHYRDIVGPRTEASHNYHLPCFLNVVGTCLGRHVFLEKAGKHYPNSFVVLVGPSGGGRKGTAINFAIELAGAIDPRLGILRSLDSREGFIEALYKIGQKQNDDSTVAAIVRLGELRSLIDKTRMEGLRNIIPALCDAYDCPPAREVQTRNKPVYVANPTVSLLAATAMRWIEGVRPEDLEGGLGNRIIWVPGQPGDPLPHPPPLDKTRYNELVKELTKTIRFWRRKQASEFSFSAEASDRWKDIYAELHDHRNDDQLIAILSERLQNHCLKAALIFAALDRDTIIQSHHLEAAHAFTRFLYDGLWFLFRGFGMSPMAQLDAKIIMAVKQAGPDGIRLPKLKHKFWRTDMETFNRRLDNLTRVDGPLRRITDGRKVLICPSDGEG